MIRNAAIFLVLGALAGCSDGKGTQYSSARAQSPTTTYIPVTPGAVPITPEGGTPGAVVATPGVLTGPVAITPGAVPVTTTPLPQTAAALVAPAPVQVVRFAKGPLYDACRTSGRETASESLCGCVQWVADQRLTPAQQRRGATYFKDNHGLQEVRQSDRSSDEQFWTAWKDFGSEAGQQCR